MKRYCAVKWVDGTVAGVEIGMAEEIDKRLRDKRWSKVADQIKKLDFSAGVHHLAGGYQLFVVVDEEG